ERLALRVRRISAGPSDETAEEPAAAKVTEDDSEQSAPVVAAEPPIARDVDATVSWTQALRAVHLQGGFAPVPANARFRYPRFVGNSGPLALRAVVQETGQE